MLSSALLTAFLIGAAWYLLVERSAIVARQAALARDAALAPGDEITTREGFPLRVVRVEGSSVVARTASGACVRVHLDGILERRPASAVADAAAPVGVVPAATRQLLAREFSEVAARWFGSTGGEQPSTA